MPQILVAGSINMDMVITADRWARPGETVRGHGFILSPGGKGANQAAAAAKLGAQTFLAARVGEDVFGEELIRSIAACGVDTEGVLRTRGVATGVAAITVCGGENSIVIDAGANGVFLPEDLDTLLMPRLSEGAPGAMAVLLQLEIPYETVWAAVRAARQARCPVFLNPAPAPVEPIPADILYGLDFLTPNESECEAITGIRVASVPDAFRAIDAMREMGVRTPVVTLGGEGAAFFDGTSNRHMEAWPTDVVDTTAAGDTFTAALAVVHAKGGSVAEGVDFARRAASVTVSRLGAQKAVPYRHEVP